MKKHLLSLLVSLAVICPAAALAQADVTALGRLDAQDPVYQRAYIYQGNCYLSSFGTSVAFDVPELVLDVAAAPVDLVAQTCGSLLQSRPFILDTVLFLYQRADARPGAFDPDQPCANLIAYDDDFCGPHSSVSNGELSPGHVDVVVTTFLNGEAGPYSLGMDSDAAPLERFIFYSGFEQGDARSWTVSAP